MSQGAWTPRSTKQTGRSKVLRLAFELEDAYATMKTDDATGPCLSRGRESARSSAGRSCAPLTSPRCDQIPPQGFQLAFQYPHGVGCDLCQLIALRAFRPRQNFGQGYVQRAETILAVSDRCFALSHGSEHRTNK